MQTIQRFALLDVAMLIDAGKTEDYETIAEHVFNKDIFSFLNKKYSNLFISKFNQEDIKKFELSFVNETLFGIGYDSFSSKYGYLKNGLTYLLVDLIERI